MSSKTRSKCFKHRWTSSLQDAGGQTAEARSPGPWAYALAGRRGCPTQNERKLSSIPKKPVTLIGESLHHETEYTAKSSKKTSPMMRQLAWVFCDCPACKEKLGIGGPRGRRRASTVCAKRSRQTNKFDSSLNRTSTCDSWLVLEARCMKAPCGSDQMHKDAINHHFHDPEGSERRMPRRCAAARRQRGYLTKARLSAQVIRRKVKEDRSRLEAG